MAGTPVLRTIPTVSVTHQNFDGVALTVPADDSKSLSAEVTTEYSPSIYVIFSNGFNSGMIQIVAAGSAVCGVSLSKTTADDTVKGPEHCGVTVNSVFSIAAAAGSMSLYVEDGTNGGYHHYHTRASYSGGWTYLVADPSQTPSAGLNGGVGSAMSLTATITHVGAYMDSVQGGENIFEGMGSCIGWVGREITIDGGTSTVGNEITFTTISERDRLATRTTVAPFTGNFIGHVEATAAGIVMRGPVQLGNANGTTVTHMLELNSNLVWPDLPVNVKFFRIDVIGAATTIIWGSATTVAGITIGTSGFRRWALNTSTQIPAGFNTYGCTLKNGRAWTLGSNTVMDGGVVQDVTDVAMDALTQIKNMQIIETRLDYGLPPASGKLTGSIFKDPVDFCMTISTQTANMTVDYDFATSARGAGKAIEFTHATGNILITASSGYYQPVAADVTVSGAGTVSFPLSSESVAFKVIDKAGANISGAQVSCYLQSDNSLVVLADTDVNGEVATTFSGTTPAAIYYRVRKSSPLATKYIHDSGVGTIATSTGFSVTRTLRVDPNNNS